MSDKPTQSDHQKKHWLKFKYNLTPEQYRAMQYKQNFCCAICGAHEPGYKRELSVDHDHLTNKVRGLLCISCNTGLGMFKDSIRLLAAAIVYLEDHGKDWGER